MGNKLIGNTLIFNKKQKERFTFDSNMNKKIN